MVQFLANARLKQPTTPPIIAERRPADKTEAVAGNATTETTPRRYKTRARRRLAVKRALPQR